MHKLFSAIAISTLLASSSVAYAFGDIVVKLEEKKPQPYDWGTLNQSPIKGKGRISVVHNEPAPGDPDAEITKAIQLLKDNGWQVSKRTYPR